MAIEERSIPLINLGKDEGDVVGKYSWAASLTEKARKEIPYIEIIEYQQTLSSILQAINYFSGHVRQAIDEGKTTDPYAGLYSVSKTEVGNMYRFPYLNGYHHNITNAWGENKGVIGKSASDILETITSGAKAIFPSAGIEGAKSWEGSQPATYNFTFHLLNTINPTEDIPRNIRLINALINNNLLDKIDFVALRPPAICEVVIPGIRATTVAVMNNINITNIGQLNLMKLTDKGADIAIPDAYEITISIQELLTESRQIWSGALAAKGDGSSKSVVFSEVDPGFSGIQSGVEEGADFLQENGSEVIKLVEEFL